MKTVYFNVKTVYGVETVDELSSTDFESLKAFRIEITRLRKAYFQAGINVYTSQRCDKTWNE